VARSTLVKTFILAKLIQHCHAPQILGACVLVDVGSNGASCNDLQSTYTRVSSYHKLQPFDPNQASDS
jgi:hypothetical protein